MVKEKPDNQRIYDIDGYKKRAACVCVRNETETEVYSEEKIFLENHFIFIEIKYYFKVLLISSSRNKDNWIIPGGGIEDNENPEQAAERECYEEAGVKGRLGRLLGVFEVLEVLSC